MTAPVFDVNSEPNARNLSGVRFKDLKLSHYPQPTCQRLQKARNPRAAKAFCSMVEILDCRLSDEHSYDDQDKGARQPITPLS
jgi:hypothetical protein